MPANVYIMEAANLFCGDHDPTNSTHLTLTELKLPTIELNYSDHTPGGAPIGIEVDTHVNKLQATFNLAGWNPLVQKLMGRSTRTHQTFTAYGAVRDRRTARLMSAVAVMQGKLAKIGPTAFSKGNIFGHEYGISGIVSYQLTLDREPLFRWDFFENEWIVGDVDVNAEMNTVLRVNGSTVGAPPPGERNI
jgi:phage tail tube protein FII